MNTAQKKKQFRTTLKGLFIIKVDLSKFLVINSVINNVFIQSQSQSKVE